MESGGNVLGSISVVSSAALPHFHKYHKYWNLSFLRLKQDLFVGNGIEEHSVGLQKVAECGEPRKNRWRTGIYMEHLKNCQKYAFDSGSCVSKLL